MLGTGGVADRERRERNGFYGAWARGGSTQICLVSLLFLCCSPASLPHTHPAPAFLWLQPHSHGEGRAPPGASHFIKHPPHPRMALWGQALPFFFLCKPVGF